MAANPNPGKITGAMWWLAEQLLALEPGTKLAGIYKLKPGYHSTGNDNERDWPGDYSIEVAEDRRGPDWRTKAAAIDWTFPEAQRRTNPDYRRMAGYGARLRAGYDSRDPRLDGWREALGQVDSDAPPEGLDFRGHFTRVPTDSHRWHWHFSEDRQHVGSIDNKKALLSVLRGQSLADWRASHGSPGTIFIPEGDDDVSAIDVWNHTISSPSLGVTKSAADWLKNTEFAVRDVRQLLAQFAAGQAELRAMLDVIATKVDIDPSELAAIRDAARQGAFEAFSAPDPNPDPTP